MTTQLEFSGFYKTLNAIKQGDNTKTETLTMMLNQFKDGSNAEGFLHELAQNYLWIGLEELFKYTDSEDLQFIGQLSKEQWDDLANKKNSDLPVHLANKMINYVKKNKLDETLSLKWKKSEREIQKHIMPMAAYITEGFIDVLE